MDTDNGAHTPMSAGVLTSTDKQHLLELVLVPLDDPTHSDWLGYELHMSKAQNGERWSLTSGTQPLFLDKRYEPEVPIICSLLKRAVEFDEPAEFSPADERDFHLGLSPNPSGVIVRVQFEHQPASSEYGWPQGVLVSKESLQRFAESVETAYSRLVG